MLKEENLPITISLVLVIVFLGIVLAIDFIR